MLKMDCPQEASERAAKANHQPRPEKPNFTDAERKKIDEIKQLGNRIRELKLARSESERPSNDSISSLVEKMDGLKREVAGSVTRELRKIVAALDGDSCEEDAESLESEVKALCDLLPSGKTKKDTEKRLKAAKKSRAASFDRKLYTDDLRVQRKIHHLLQSEGSGDTFRYFPNRLATEVHGIVSGDPDKPVVLTEKWDGTTVQATNKGIFKRRENFKKGDVRKYDAGEEDRYGIERLNIGFDEFVARRKGLKMVRNGKFDPWAKHIREACEKYFPVFAGLDDGVCVYFEAVGTRIQARYRIGAPEAEPWHDIRVFDFSVAGRFLPWIETCALATKLGLPLVGHSPPAPLDLPLLLDRLGSNLHYECAAESNHPASRALLEGFVVRGLSLGVGTDDREEPIAKIRVDDMQHFA